MFLSQLSLSVLTLSVTIGSNIGAALPVLSTTESESLIFSDNNPNSKEVNGEVRCECVLYFLCDRENVVVWPTSGDDYDQNECTHDFVCCKTPNTELPPTTRRPSQENSTVYFPVDSDERNVTEEVTTFEATTEDGIIGQLCQCVLPKQCQPENVIDLPFVDIQNQCQGENVCCLMNSTSLSTPQTVGPNELECECMAFYLCSTEDVIDLPIIEDQCPISEVCCKKSNSSLPITDTTPSNNTKVIIYGISDGNNEEKLECECQLFYVCSPENIIELPTTYNNKDQCSNVEVCCKKSNLNSTSLPSPSVTEPIQSNNTKIIIYGVSDDNDEEKLACECMLFYLCPTEDVIELPTTYNNKDQCSNSEFCCKKSKLTPPITSKPVESTTPNNTNKVITYGVTDDYYPKELKCECVVFYLCPEEDVIELTSTFEKDRCSDSNVCCKTPDFISLPTPPPPQPEPSNSTKEIIIYGVSDDDEPKELACKCVTFFLCDDSQVIRLPTKYNDKDSCSDTDVCCKIPSDSIPSSSPQLPEPTLSNNKTKEVVMCGVNDSDESEELDCECVSFYLCSSENVIELPKNYKKDRCSESKVCCKKSQLSSSTSMILPPPEPSLPSEPVPPKNVRGRPVTMEFTFKITWWR